MSDHQKNPSVGIAVRELNQLLRQVERPQRAERSNIPTGCTALDRLLGGQGFERGSLSEWLGDGAGNGASTLALVIARQACQDGGALIVIDRRGTFYPPAAAAWHVDLDNLILVRPQNDKDEHWALDQSLRCEHVAAVLAWPERLDSRTFRRLELAAEASGCLGLLIRPLAAVDKPSWADVRLLVSPQASLAGWCLRVQLLRLRGGFGEGEIELEIDDRTGEIHETHPGNLATRLAHPTTRDRSA